MDVRTKVINNLNKNLGSDITHLAQVQQLFTDIQEQKNAIEKSLSLASSEVPSKVAAAVRGVEQTSRDINRVTAEFDSLCVNIRNQLMKSESTTNQLQEYIDKIENLERMLAYICCIRTIEDISSGLESSLSEKDDTKSIELYLSLCNLSRKLQNSECQHLLCFLNDTLHFWHNLLKEKYDVEYSEVLKQLKWPFVHNSISGMPTEAVQRFQLLTEYLLHLQLPDHLLPQPVVTSTLLTDFAPLSLPVALLIRPLRKRFLYHFYGAKQTNRADKPEWFFTQVLTWIRDHEKFMVTHVQPVFNRLNMHPISARLQLVQGLVQLVVEKLHSELPHLQFDDALFSHAVDETLGFDRELRESFRYPPTQPRVISVLTQAPIFVKWIHMEKKYATEKMDAMLSSETAWSRLGAPELDEMCLTECGESFLTLLQTMTERYNSLPQPGHRLQFLELQLELLDDFRVRLLQLLHEELSDPLHSHLPAILNTVNYLASVLQEWGSQTHFLQLQYYKNQFEKAGDAAEMNDMIKLDALQGTVFDEIVCLLHRMKDELIYTLCETVMMDVIARSREYRKDKWFVMPSPREVINPTVTPSACAMFQVLAERLHRLQEMLSVPLFTAAWQTLATQLNQFIFEEVILQNTFNEGGAMQLQFDMTRNMFPLFGQFTHKPDLYFPHVKESCVLLNLAKGSALLLRETLKSCLSDGGVEGLQEETVLADVGVHQLDAEKATTILSLRSDISRL